MGCAGRVVRPDIRFRGLTLNVTWEALDVDALLGVLFDNWIEPADHVEAVGAFEAEPFEDRGHMRYRFRVRNDDGLHVFEQHAYFDVDDAGRISAMSTVCFGYRKRPED